MTLMPRQMAFFWYGQMSWMRFLTLASFRFYNPDWEVYLYSPVQCGGALWKSHERDDSSYKGKDYRSQLSNIGVVCRDCPVDVSGVAPAQASDIFQWNQLGHNGGFYADMDILWLKPLEPLRKQVENADAVFCLEGEEIAVGFCAGNNNCHVFSDLPTVCGSVKNYQGFGSHLLKNAYGGKNGHRLIDAMRKKYPKLTIVTVPDATVYPFDWKEVDKIFLNNLKPPTDAYGIHWFGANPISQKWNKILVPKSNTKNTFENCLSEEFKSWIYGKV